MNRDVHRNAGSTVRIVQCDAGSLERGQIHDRHIRFRRVGIVKNSVAADTATRMEKKERWDICNESRRLPRKRNPLESTESTE